MVQRPLSSTLRSKLIQGCSIVAQQPRDTLPQFYFDSLVHDADALRFLLRLAGARRIALGSDYPFPLGERTPGALIESMDDLDASTRERLLRGTALEFLGISA